MDDKDQIKSDKSEESVNQNTGDSVADDAQVDPVVDDAQTQNAPADAPITDDEEEAQIPEPEVEAEAETPEVADQTPEIASPEFTPDSDPGARNDEEESVAVSEDTADADVAEEAAESGSTDNTDSTDQTDIPISSDLSDAPVNDNPNAKWYVVHTFSGHENKVATNLKQRIESEHLENRIIDILVPTQDKIEIRGGKKEQVKEKIFPGYILVKMDLDDASWLAVRTTQGVTAFVGMNNKPTPISEREVQSIVKFMTQGAPATFKDVFMVDDTVRIIDGPFTDFIGKVESVDKEKGKVRVLVSIFGRETPVELDFLQVTKL